MGEYLKSRIKSFSHAFAGISYLLRTQKNSWIHLFFTILAIITSIWLSISIIEFAIIILTIGFVWAAEAFNSGIELAVDLASPTSNVIAKNAKDVSAAGVLFSAIASIFVGLLIFGPKLYSLIFNW